MSYVSLGAGFSFEASTSGGVKTSATGVPIQTVNVPTTTQITSSGSSAAPAPAFDAAAAAAKIFAIQSAARKEQERQAAAAAAAKLIQLRARQSGDVAQAGMSRNTKLLWGAAAVAAGVAVVWALKRKKAPAKMAANRKRMRRNARGARYSGWFIADRDLILGYRDGHDQLLPRTKRGIPRGAQQFDSEADALRELGFLDRQGFYPLFTPEAKAVKLGWS